SLPSVKHHAIILLDVEEREERIEEVNDAAWSSELREDALDLPEPDLFQHGHDCPLIGHKPGAIVPPPVPVERERLRATALKAQRGLAHEREVHHRFEDEELLGHRRYPFQRQERFWQVIQHAQEEDDVEQSDCL